MNAAVALLLGTVAGLGLVMIGDGWRRRPTTTAPATGPFRWAQVSRSPTRLLAAVAAAVMAAVLTGWPVGGALAGLAVLALPGLLGRDREGHTAIARVEAIAGWTELLRSTLAAAAGLQQTIVATAAMAPEAIRPQVTALAQRLRGGQRLPQALRVFADEVDDPTGDMVVAALQLAADRPGANLAELLGALAGAARDQVAMRHRVAASRARVRTSARIITGITVAMVLGLVTLNRQWMAPFDTATGQLVMLTAGVLFAGGLLLLQRMSKLAAAPRLFTPGGSELR